MRRTVSLSEFMPYGAPELLAARCPHLALALTISSLFMAMLFAVALGIIPLSVRPIIPVMPCSPFHQPEAVLLPPPIEIPEHTTPGIVPPSTSGPAIPIPVVDPVVPQTWTDIASPSVTDSHGEGVIDIPTSTPGSGTAPATRLPTIDEYVPVDELPEPIREYKPPYPDLAKEAGVEGLVIVHALIGVEGT